MTRKEEVSTKAEKAFCYSQIVQGRLIPKLNKGVEKGRLELTGEDCEKLLFVLRTSVPLEPFLSSFVEIIGNTIDDHYRRRPANDGP